MSTYDLLYPISGSREYRKWNTGILAVWKFGMMECWNNGYSLKHYLPTLPIFQYSITSNPILPIFPTSVSVPVTPENMNYHILRRIIFALDSNPGCLPQKSLLLLRLLACLANLSTYIFFYFPYSYVDKFGRLQYVRAHDRQ